MSLERKTLEQLNLLDRFLFAEAVDRPEVAALLLEIILGKEVALQYLPQTEKEIRTSPQKRCVRLNVWMMDQEGVVYDAEVQKRDTKNLPKRSRYYQGLLDSNLLEPGDIDFNNLNPVCLIIISPFDIGGKKLYQYTYRMRCDEAP